MSRGLSSWGQIRLLLWRNFIMKKRNLGSTISELVLPLFFMLLFTYLHSLDPQVKMDQQCYTSPQAFSVSPSVLPESLIPESLLPPSIGNASDAMNGFFEELITEGFGPGIQTVPPFLYLLIITANLNKQIALAPDDPHDAAKLQWIHDIRENLDDMTEALNHPLWQYLGESLLQVPLCPFGNLTKVYNSEQELIDYVKSPVYGTSKQPLTNGVVDCPSKMNSPEHPDLHFALVIRQLGTLDTPWQYTIHSNISATPLTFKELGLVDHLRKGVKHHFQDRYMMSGFLTLQMMVDRLLINKEVPDKKLNALGFTKFEKLALTQLMESLHFGNITAHNGIPGGFTPPWMLKAQEANRPDSPIVSFVNAIRDFPKDLLKPLLKPVSMIPNDIRMTEFPTEAYFSRPFFGKIKDVFALVLILTYLWPTSRLLRAIVQEKETRVREGMFMMGLKSHSLYISWLLSYGLIFSLIALLITLTTANSLFEGSSPVLIFLFFTLFGFSVISFCFMISVFFSRAKTAGTAGVTLFFMGFLGYFAVIQDSAPASAKLSASILSPTAFGLGASIICQYELEGSGVLFSNLFERMNDGQISFFTCLAMLALDSVIYTILAAYLDRVVPQSFGVALPWHFVFHRSYWFGDENEFITRNLTSDETLEQPLVDNQTSIPIEPVSQQHAELARQNRSVSLRNLRKVYPSSNSNPDRVAVNDVSMTMYEGQITVLLGHNGAGKSTTVSCLSGLTPLTSGSASVFGMDVGTEMSQIRKTLGVCPQHDVLFDDLTVAEHLEFFARLKGMNPDTIPERVDLQIRQVGLVEKRNTFSSQLSGGQKRKLSVAIALLGDSKIVFLDEPTSGMDPASRRSTWELLRNNTSGRVIVLTTHFMDEADVLGDQIAILSQGKLQCHGSPMFLKSKFGVGYSLTLVGATGVNVIQIQDFIFANLSTQVKMLNHSGKEVTFRIPFSLAPQFPAFFTKLDQELATLGISSYGISVTTLEEVFMRVAAGEDVATVGSEEDEDDLDEEEGELHYDSQFEQQSVQSSQDRNVSSSLRTPLLEDDVSETSSVASSVLQSGNDKFKRTSFGGRRFARQFHALFMKRFHFAKRDRKSICCNLLLPILNLLLGMVMLKAFPLRSAPTYDLDVSNITPKGACNWVPFNNSNPSSPDVFHNVPFVVDAKIDPNAVNNCTGEPPSKHRNFFEGEVRDGSSLRGLSDWLLDHKSEFDSPLFGAVQVSESKLDEMVSVTLLVNSTAHHGPGIFLNYIDDILFRYVSGGKPEQVAQIERRRLDRIENNSSLNSNSIQTAIHPFPFTAKFTELVNQVQAVNVAVNLVISFSFISPSIIVYIVKEREVGAKHQQVLMGATRGAFWSSSYLFDVLVYMFTLGIAMVIVQFFKVPALMGRNLVTSMTLLAIYGLAVIPFSYCVSFLFRSHSTAQNVALLIGFVTGIVLMISSFVMGMVESTHDANLTLMYIYRIFPGFCLGNGLLNIALNNVEASIGIPGLGEASLFQWDIAGADLCFLAIESVLYLILAIVLDSADDLKRVLFKDTDVAHDSANSNGSSTVEDVDVHRERDRILALEEAQDERSIDDDAIVCRSLRKVYNADKVAVQDLTFGIRRGDCFGFLGVNGAGKTSTLKMLTGDLAPTRGSGKLHGLDIISQQDEVRKLIGYCPQFDSLLEWLTPREHLEMYGRLKMIPETTLGKYVNRKLRQLRLTEFADQPSCTLSGGNKRKLCVAVALTGSSPIIFLDEPSTGVDPVNKRYMWNQIGRIIRRKKDCTVVLTTHSMEECEALCSTVGIMVAGRLRCLGPIQHLKNKYGYGLTVSIKMMPPREQAFRSVNQLLVDKCQSLPSRRGGVLSPPTTNDDRNDIAPSPRHGAGDVELSLGEGDMDWACATLGNPSRSSKFCEDDTSGWVVHSALKRDGKVSSMIVAEWWVSEDLWENLEKLIRKEFVDAKCLERHGSSSTWQIPTVQSIGEVFETFEVNKTAYSIQDYSVTQATLEQIFIRFANSPDSSAAGDVVDQLN